jgi:hypothetical protein
MGLGVWRSWIQSILLNSFYGVDVWSQEGRSKRVFEVVVKNEEVSVVGVRYWRVLIGKEGKEEEKGKCVLM